MFVGVHLWPSGVAMGGGGSLGGTYPPQIISAPHTKNHAYIYFYLLISCVSYRAVDESQVPVSRPKASSPGRKKIVLDTRK